MIKDPLLIIAILLLIEASILFLAGRKSLKKYFHFIPPVFWIYAIPMLCSSFGLITAENPLYATITANLLPASLILLLLSTDLKAISRLGTKSLVMMFAGSLSIMIAIPIIFYLFKNIIGISMWSGFGALSASWVGGSANMIAAKEALGTPDQVFAPVLIVDTIVPYVWMAFLVAAVVFQDKFDRMVKADTKVMEELHRHMEDRQELEKSFSLKGTFFIIFIAIAGVTIARSCAYFLPNIKNVISSYAWAIIIASSLGVLLSFTPIKKLEGSHATTIGYWLLYFVLTTIGAKVCIYDFNAALILIGAGFCVVVLHGAMITLVAKLIRAPMFLVATASQANIGGPASAPIVAAVYQPALACVGVLMAVLGNILGTYTGIITGYICKMIAHI